MVLLDAAFDNQQRIAILAELSELQANGRVVLGRDDRWRPVQVAPSATGPQRGQANPIPSQPDRPQLVAVPATTSSQVQSLAAITDDDADVERDPAALLRYYRSALQSDPRGAITQTDDRHGQAFQFLTGRGRLIPSDNEAVVLRIRLEDMPAKLREALERRHGEENGLAVGWPISVERDKGLPVIRPVGLLAGLWQRTENHLEIRIDFDDVLANPDWVRSAARRSTWNRRALEELFRGPGNSGLPGDEFLARLREAAAPSVRGQLSDNSFAALIDPQVEGIIGAAALFLPTETTFTAGAVSDLDQIANWPRERLTSTALSTLLGMAGNASIQSAPAINTGPLNLEQIQAVENAMSAPLSVVTGPPGTGKSQAIVAMAATALWNGQSVVLASRNHQALDAVEERLGEIAPDVPFMVRTLDPAKDINVGMKQVLADLVSEQNSILATEPEAAVAAELDRRAAERRSALQSIGQRRKLRLQLADDVERLEARVVAGLAEGGPQYRVPEGNSFWRRLLTWLGLQRNRTPGDGDSQDAISTHALTQRIKSARSTLASEREQADPVAMTTEIGDLARKLLARRVTVGADIDQDTRIALRNTRDDLDLEGASTVPRVVAEQVLQHRPMWLASVLGAPRRIPLEEGLFDLVIFDEASQCDIGSALPLLARARRAVIVGDDRQLAFIPQIGVAQDRNLMAAQKLPLKGMGRFAQGSKSLFDLARSTPGVSAIMLRDQYRSATAIVDYINSDFYGGHLRVSADERDMKTPPRMKPGLAWTDVPAVGATTLGNRNHAEIEAIASHLEKLLKQQKFEGSIGVISPFRSQVQALAEEIDRRIPAVLRKSAQLRISTIDGFQGQERDLILFSPVVHAGIASSAVVFLQRDWRRFNVAISRARAVAHIFGDLDYARSGAVRRLQSLAAFATESRSATSATAVFDSMWERRIYEALRDRGLDPHPQFEIAGRRLDFALFGKSGVKLDLEIDGRRWHQDADGNRKLDDIWRDHQLTSLGWRVRRFWVDELHQDLEGCLEQIERDLE